MIKRIKTMIRIYKRRFNSILTWIPIIVMDDHHSYHWFLRMLKTKFQLMEKFYRTEAFGVDDYKIADELKSAWILCERLEDNNYYKNIPIGMQPIDALREEYDLIQQDVLKLCNIISNLSNWWD